MKKNPFFPRLLENLHSLIYSESYKDFAKVHPSDFSRRRKMSFVQYILFILQKTGRSLQAALNTFCRSMGEDMDSYSKQAFSKGRLRIKPEAIRLLFDFSVEEFYNNADYQTLDGFRVLAIDGTRLNLPNTSELAQEFQVQTSQGPDQVQALVSGMYDVLNKVMVDVRISSCKSSERTHAAEMIRNLNKMPHQKNLLIMDRGYPSAELIKLLQDNNHAFLLRCEPGFIKGMKLQGDDCVITHHFSRMKKHPLTIRIVKLRLTEDNPTILVTNLSPDVYPSAKLAEIYKMRWDIESRYDDLKNKLYIENFSGTKKVVILQDFYATMLLWNMTGMMMFDVKDDIEAHHNSQENKYTYQLNISMTISTLKERVVELVMCENKRKSMKILREIERSLRNAIVAVKPSRKFPRKRKHTALKYHNNSKFS